MRYLGGKSKTARLTAGFINNLIAEYRLPYWEPFLGGGWVTQYVHAERRYASDIHMPLMYMWQELQRGWIPPEQVSEEEYKAARNGKTHLANYAFIGFAGSWGGKWWGGYARGEGRNYIKESKFRLLDKIGFMLDVIFFAADFLIDSPPETQCIIYCDPPYGNTTEYKGIKFNTDAFWDRVRYLDSLGHILVISEYEAPEDFTCVEEYPIKLGLHKRTRIEKLFMPINISEKIVSVR